MHDDQTSDRGAWVVLGGVHLLNREVCRPATTVVVRIDGGELFPDAIAGLALRGLVGAEAARGLVPLCYLAELPDGGYHAYAQIRFHPEDACFVRTTREPVGHGPVEELRWLDPVLTTHAESSTALNNHLRYFRKHFSGTELEFKYTLN
ncbi:hypothetical protein ACFWNO_28195, partial [Streptomyces sp. NPDC058394]